GRQQGCLLLCGPVRQTRRVCRNVGWHLAGDGRDGGNGVPESNYARGGAEPRGSWARGNLNNLETISRARGDTSKTDNTRCPDLKPLACDAALLAGRRFHHYASATLA